MEIIMNKFLTGLNLVILSIVIILIGLVFVFRIPNGSLDSTSSDFSDGWYYDDGTPADPGRPSASSADGWATISRETDSSEIRDADLCFTANNMYFEIFLDNEKIYSFTPELIPLYGDCYGTYIHTVNIPAFEGRKTLSIRYKTLITGSWTNFRNMKIEDGTEYLHQLLRENFGKFLLSYSSLFLGIILIVCGLFMTRNMLKTVETVALGTMIVLLACYTHTNTAIVSVISSDPAILRLIEHMALVFLPAPAMIFAAAFTDSLNSKLLRITLAAVGINAITVTVCMVFRICDFHYLLPITHMTIAAGMVFLVILFAHDLSIKKKRNLGYKYLAVAFGILVISGIGDLLSYYIPSKSYDSAASSRCGLLIFTLILLWYEIISLAEVNRKSAAGEVMNRLAHIDTLTGLGNRTSFDESERRLSEQSSGKCAIVQLDVNYLKQVNDNYGHIEGDRHLCATADCMKTSFGTLDNAECFRTGGDEFVVIIYGNDAIKDYDKAIRLFNGQIQKYNSSSKPQIPLSVACGMAELDCSLGTDPHVIEKLADERMYENKQLLKQDSLTLI